MASYTVTLIDAEGEESTFECDEDVLIMDQADEEGIDMPYSCRAGACSTCAGKIIEGTVNQEEQSNRIIITFKRTIYTIISRNDTKSIISHRFNKFHYFIARNFLNFN